MAAARASLASRLIGLTTLAGIVAFLTFTQCACGPRRRDAIALGPDASWEGTLDLRAQARLDFALTLPADAVLTRIQLECDYAELELFARCGEPIEDVDEATYAVTEVGLPRELDLDCRDPDPLAGATWHLTALWPFYVPSRVDGAHVAHAPVRLEVETFTARVDAELVPGEPLRSELDTASGGFRTFHLSVPEGASALRVDLFDVSSNLDLYARRGAQILARDEGVACAEHNWGHETLLLDRASTPALAAGDWYLDVFDAFGPTRTLPFSILATCDAAVPEPLRALPVLPRPAPDDPLAPALLAVVELAGEFGIGSGTLLTPDGCILTNAHVVADALEGEIVVSFSLDPTLPPQEAFRAELLCADSGRDLALVRIASGLYGQPLPPGYVFPSLALGDPGALAIGDPLWLVGYPTTGGTGSRVTISATRGILAGFERADFGVLLKTDAEITDGNSGGAALDERGLLIGVPSSTVENGSGQIGYVHPITALPREWLRRIGR